MNRFCTSIGFAMIFMVIGSMIGFVVFWVVFIAFAITYQLVMGQVLNIGDGVIFESIKAFTTLACGMITTAWVLHHKNRNEKRSKSEQYLKCLTCGYDLRGNTSNQCPECGHKLTGAQLSALRIDHA